MFSTFINNLLTEIYTWFKSDVIQHNATSGVSICLQNAIHNNLVDAHREARE